MPSLEVVEVVDAKPFENAAISQNAAVDEDSNDDASDKTAEMSEEVVDYEDPTTEGPSPVVDEKSDVDSNAGPPMNVELKQRGPTDAAAAATTTVAPTSEQKKRNVTPNETASEKKKQQKKVNQLSLSRFFKTPYYKGTVTSSRPSIAASKQTRAAKQAKTSSRETLPYSKEYPEKKTSETTESTAANVQERQTEMSLKNKASPCPKTMTATDSLQCLSPKENTHAKTVGCEKSKHDIIKIDLSEKGDDDSASAESTSNKTAARKPSVPIGDVNDSGEMDVTTEPKKDVVTELSQQQKDLIKKHEQMRQRCQQRAEKLVKGARDGVDEEDFEMPSPEPKTDLPADEEFPDAVLANMVLLIEGSEQSLSKLTSKVCQRLKECHQKNWTKDSVSTKIKLIADRKPYLDNVSSFKNDIGAKYEDESIDRMWRWEVGIMEVLPSSILPKVRKARTARRKMLSHYATNQRLLKSFDDADAAILQGATPDTIDPLLAKIVKDEEKILKYERDFEKQRLAVLARKKKEQELEAKKQEKERKKEEAEKKRLEKEREKQEAADAREAEKRKKTEEKERAVQHKREKEEQKKLSLSKQKACLRSFFAAPTAQTATISDPSSPATKIKNEESSSAGFDVDKFRSLIDSETSLVSRPLFPRLSKSAIKSRKRRTRKVPVAVYVTVMPEGNAFDEQPFAEQQIIHIPNKYLFLSFYEDYRPPYHGTWSKTSKIVTGKNPFGKDTAYLNYDYDSEAEWEEGDDEIGEDVDDDAKNQEEEDEEGVAAKMYDYEDGFCVADDQYLDIDDEVDEETKALYRKKLERVGADITANRICIVGPQMGGTPANENSTPELMEGFGKDEASELMTAHTGHRLCHDLLWLDAFAPDKIDELQPTSETERCTTSSSNKDEHTVEEMKALATFAHHCTLNSKEKLIEELRNANPNSFDSRAKATRKLDSIAEKKKCPNGPGVYWEVKKEILEELELNDVLARKLAGGEELDTITKPKAPITKKRKISDSAASATAPSEPTLDVKPVAPQVPSPSDKAESPNKISAPSLASAATMMNFLQPRKKCKTK